MISNLSASFVAVAIVSILISMVVHEFMHAFVGYKLGDTTARDEGRLSLNPLRHIDPFSTIVLPVLTLLVFHVPVLAAKPVPFNPARVKYDEYGAAMIAAAGPVANLLLAALGALLLQIITPGSFLGDAIGWFTVINVALFVFNLVPIPPLDGSRVLYAFAPDPVRRFFEQIEPFGLIVIFGLVLYGGLGNALVNIDQAILNFLT